MTIIKEGKKFSKEKILLKNFGHMIFFITLFIAITGILSCSLQSGSSPEPIPLDVETIKEGAFRGGSLIYNPDDQSVNHLIENMEIPIRLSKLESVYNKETEKMELRDIPASVRYGIITLRALSTNSITIDYTLYSATGAGGNRSTTTLISGDSVDIDNDGISDLSYKQPPDRRAGFTHAMYLSFLCSEDTKTTTMYKLSTEHYPGNRYPSGIIGVNPSGNFLILNMDFVSAAKGPHNTNIYSASGGAYAYKDGDYILGGENGRFEEIAEVSSTKAGDLNIRTSADEITINNAIQVMHLNLNGDLEEILTRYGDESNRAYYDIFTYNYTYYFFNNSAGYCKLANNFRFGVNVDASVTVTWCSVYGYARTSLVLSNTAALDAELNYSYKYETKKLLWEPKKTFLVYGIPVELKMPIYWGVDVSANAKATFHTSVSMSVTAGAGVDFSAGWLPPHIIINPYPIFSTSLSYTPPSYSLSGNLTVTPYLEINPAITIAYAITPECVNKIYVTGYVGFEYSNYQRYLKANITTGITSDAYINIIGLWRPHLGQLINYSKLLYSYYKPY